ncbi:MAG: hypothetical protein ACOYVK_18925 [Bacillota bacterium]
MENLNCEQMVSQMEETINNIPEVISSKVIFDQQNEIEEIHVLASNNRNAKQISRDIQSALTAKFDVKIDHKKISVAQIGFKQDIESEYRLRINSIGYGVIGNLAEIKVILQKGEQLIEGIAKGINSKNNVYRLVVNATLDCIHAFIGVHNTFVVEDVEKICLAKREVMVTAISLITEHGEELMVGSSVVRKDEYESIVRATLDAINRRVIKVNN